jgi:hypothetical protein
VEQHGHLVATIYAIARRRASGNCDRDGDDTNRGGFAAGRGA